MARRAPSKGSLLPAITVRLMALSSERGEWSGPPGLSGLSELWSRCVMRSTGTVARARSAPVVVGTAAAKTREMAGISDGLPERREAYTCSHDNDPMQSCRTGNGIGRRGDIGRWAGATSSLPG